MAEVDSPGRRGLLAGVSVAALAAGAGLGWWRLRPSAVEPTALPVLWGHRFDTLDGGTLAMESLRGRPLLMNFWATWCAPCVEEMPLLDRFYRDNAASGLQVVGLAIDQPSSVRRFLQRTPVTFPIVLAGLEGTELIKSLGNTAGGLPFSLLLAADGQVRQRRMGQLHTDELARWKASLTPA